MKLSTTLAIALSFAVGAVGVVGQATAGELDPSVDQVPRGLVVRIDAEGKHEVFKADLSQGVVDNDAAAAVTLKSAVTEANKVESVQPASELDRTTSDEQYRWGWSWYNNSYYTYSYYRCGSYYSYYPSYSYYYGGYQYNYYYTSYYYSYSPSYYSCSDRYGWHYGRDYGWHNRGRYRY